MGATTLGPNDSFVLGTLSGPKFSIQMQPGAGHNHSRNAQSRHPSQAGYGNALGQEVQRQVETQLLTKFPMFRIAYEYWYKYKTGVLSQPRNIIALIVLALGFFGTGCIGCMGSIAAMIQQFVP